MIGKNFATKNLDYRGYLQYHGQYFQRLLKSYSRNTDQSYYHDFFTFSHIFSCILFIFSNPRLQEKNTTMPLSNLACIFSFLNLYGHLYRISTRKQIHFRRKQKHMNSRGNPQQLLEIESFKQLATCIHYTKIDIYFSGW